MNKAVQRSKADGKIQIQNPTGVDKNLPSPEDSYYFLQTCGWKKIQTKLIDVQSRLG